MRLVSFLGKCLAVMTAHERKTNGSFNWGTLGGLRAQREAGRKVAYLYSSFGQVNPGSQLGADMDIGVVGEVKELLQLLELLRGESSANSPLSLFFLCRRKHATWVSDFDVSPLGR